MASNYIDDDPRIDPRLKEAYRALPFAAVPDVASRESLLAEETTTESLARYAGLSALMDSMGSEQLAPSDGLVVRDEKIASAPDGNAISLLITRPNTTQVLPCVYYIHGGAMQTGSCYSGTYTTWARLLAALGVVVVMVDFRNCLIPSSVPEVAPFPAGLNDCVSGLLWLHAHTDELNVDPKRLVVSGESGGGNLALAVGLSLKLRKQIQIISGIYALCPYIAGEWPLRANPSSIENRDILPVFYNNRGRMSYGIEAFNNRDPLAWPSFATEKDVEGFPPVVISVNECDPLRDEGVNFYRLLLRSGVPARCRQIMGTTHGAEIFPLGVCPEISKDAAAHIAAFCMESRTAALNRN